MYLCGVFKDWLHWEPMGPGFESVFSWDLLTIGLLLALSFELPGFVPPQFYMMNTQIHTKKTKI